MPDRYDYNEMRDVGNVLMGLGSRIGQIYVDRLETSDKANARARQYEQITEFQDWLDKNRDKPESWIDEFNKRREEMSEKILKPIKTPGAKNQIQAELTVDMADYESHLSDIVKKQINANTIADYKVNMSNYTSAPAAGSIYDENEVKTRLKNVVMLTDELNKTGDLTDAERDIEEKEAAKAIVSHFVLQQALQANDADKYFANINGTIKEKFGIEGLMTTEDVSKLKKQYEANVSINKAKLKVVQDGDKQRILDRFLAKQFDADPKNGINDDIFSFINQTSLEPDEKEQWMNKARSWANNAGKEIQSDVRKEAELENRALDISTGAVKREDFIKEVTDAAFGAKPTIDSDAFDSLMATANREHKTYQANAMGEAVNYGLRQLTHTDEEITKITESLTTTGFDYNEVLKRISSIKRLQEENFSQYKRALNEWFQAEKAAGRDPDDDDIYVKSRKLLSHYRNRNLTESIYKEQFSPEERDRIETIAQFFTGPRPAAVGSFQGQEGKSPYKEYPDAFYEAGIWKVIRNGKKYRIEE